MNIQESNITVSDVEITVEKFEEASSVNEPSAQVISCKLNEREIKDEYFDVPEFIAHEDIVIKTEDEEGDHSNSKYFNTDYEKSRKIFMCRYCGFGLSTEEYKNAHEGTCKLLGKKQHLGGRPLECSFECSYCKFLYLREEDKNKHQAKCKKRKKLEKYEGERKYCCDKCSYETKRNSCLITHMRIHDKVNAPKYSCLQCPYQTINKSDLKKHFRTHNCFRLICVLCQKSFKGKGSLDAHYVTRHPDSSEKWLNTITYKINECPKCLYKTINILSFKRHLMAHGTPAQLKCNICGYECIEKSNFTKHLCLHLGQLPFMCTKCDKRFNSKQHLDGHIVSQHSENEELMSSVTKKVHQCDKCDYETVKNSNLKRHLKICL